MDHASFLNSSDLDLAKEANRVGLKVNINKTKARGRRKIQKCCFVNIVMVHYRIISTL